MKKLNYLSTKLWEMKINIKLIALFLLTLNISRANEVVDKGFGDLRIDTKYMEIENYLSPIESENWIEEMKRTQGYVTTGWFYDFQKAEVTSFYGLNVKRVEVYMKGNKDDADDRRIYSFEITLIKPTTSNAISDFIDELIKVHGQGGPWLNQETNELYQLDWRSETTSLTVELGFNIFTGVEKEFYRATFCQAYEG